MGPKSFSVVLILFFAASAKAIVGPAANIKDGGPQSSCRILGYKTSGTLDFLCSGNLIRSQTVITAAHCFDPTPSRQDMALIKIQCGYEGTNPQKLKLEETSSGNKVFTEGVLFKEETRIAEIHYVDGSDQALLKLSRPLPLQTAPYTSLKTLDPQEKCFHAGFGLDNSGRGGLLRSGSLSREALSIMDQDLQIKVEMTIEDDQDIEFLSAESQKNPRDNVKEVFLKFSPRMGRSTIGLLGDSGGGIFCKAPGEKNFFLVAIKSSLNVRLDGMMDVILNLIDHQYLVSSEAIDRWLK